MLVTACDTPPQVVEISPDRNSQQVASNADVRIRFDRPVDRASVSSRFSVSPAVTGKVTWTSASQLVFHHTPFRAGTTYEVRLAAGYRDATGHANTLNHGWQFSTEAPPALVASTPAAAEQNVDPAADLVLTFSRRMDLKTLATALTVSPSVHYQLKTDPADDRHVIVAPQTLLDAGATYSVTVTHDAHDVDGNPLATGVAIEFGTGPLRPLRHWLTFGAGQGLAADGIWVADEHRMPREVAPTPATTFSWSQDGTHLLVQGMSGAWSDVTVGGSEQLLPFKARWAAFLAPGAGYVYLQPDGVLARLTADGQTVMIDRQVEEAAVATGGRRIAYVTNHSTGESEIRGYEVDLHSHYRLQVEPQPVDGLTWAPDGSRLAYRVATSDPARFALRVRDLGADGGIRTVGLGEVSTPTWQPDSRHLVVSGTVAGAGGLTSRAFRLSSADSATRALVYDDSIPSPPDVQIRDPLPSPDGHQLAFLAPSPGGDQVWMMNADGTGLAQVTRFDAASFPYSCLALTWTRS